MRGLKFILGVILIVLVINMSGLVFALNDLVALQGNVKQAGVVLSSGNLTVVIYDSESGGNIIYNSTNDFDNSIFNGKYGVMLGNGSNELNLNFSQLYYLDIWVNGENFNFSGNDRQMFQSSVGDLIVNGTGVLLNIKNDTNSFLFVTGDSGYIGVGTTSPSNTLDVRGQGNFSGKVYINNATDISTWESNVSRNWTIPAIDYANLLNKTKNIQEILNSTGVYSIPLTINNTKNLQEILNSTGIYTIPLTINSSENLIPVLEGLINSTSWLRNGANVILSNLGDLIGIGTATPTAVLEINSTNPNLLNISNSSDTILFVNGSTGDVGIGTSNPDSALDVSGGNLTITNETASPLYFKFSEGGYMYDNGTALILGHD